MFFLVKTSMAVQTAIRRLNIGFSMKYLAQLHCCTQFLTLSHSINDSLKETDHAVAYINICTQPSKMEHHNITNTNHDSSDVVLPMSSEVNIDKAHTHTIHIHSYADGTFATLHTRQTHIFNFHHQKPTCKAL